MKIYTMGYGLLKGTHAERKLAFQDRLRKFGKSWESLCVVDIRRHNSGSRNGKAFKQQWWPIIKRPSWDFSYGMAKTVFGLGEDFYYYSVPALANTFGKSRSDLSLYRDWLQSLLTNHNDPAFRLKGLVADIQRRRGSFAFVLLCGCRDAYKPSGAINCHRVPLSEVLLRELGNRWEVEHL